MQDKAFLEAYLYFNPKELEDTDIGTQITYDVLNVVINKKNVKKFIVHLLDEI